MSSGNGLVRAENRKKRGAQKILVIKRNIFGSRIGVGKY